MMPYKLSVGHLAVFLRQIFSVIFASCSVLIFSLPASITKIACFISFHPHHSMLLIFLMLFCDHIITIQSLSIFLLCPSDLITVVKFVCITSAHQKLVKCCGVGVAQVCWCSVLARECGRNCARLWQ